MNAPDATSLIVRTASRFGVDPDKMMATLRATCFKTKEPATNEQMMALLIVAEQYKLSPWTKEIFAFEDKHKGIVPVVSVDGWARIVNEHPAYNGCDFRYAEKMATMSGGKPCPEWCEVVIYRKDRDHAIIVREYLDEVYQPPRGGYSGAWQSHTKRFLRHKTFIQGSRIAFGFAGIYDEDEAHRIVNATPAPVNTEAKALEGEVVAYAEQRQQAVAAPAVDPILAEAIRVDTRELDEGMYQDAAGTQPVTAAGQPVEIKQYPHPAAEHPVYIDGAEYTEVPTDQ